MWKVNQRSSVAMGLTRKLVLGLFCLTVLLDGCQATRPSRTSGVSEPETFMKLWGIYSHCRSSTDPDTMLTDSRRLNRAVATSFSGETVHSLLRDTIQALN